MTCHPSRIKASAAFTPMNPAPPVITTVLVCTSFSGDRVNAVRFRRLRSTCLARMSNRRLWQSQPELLAARLIAGQVARCDNPTCIEMECGVFDWFYRTKYRKLRRLSLKPLFGAQALAWEIAAPPCESENPDTTSLTR